MQYFMRYDSPLGLLTLTASDAGLSGVYFEQHTHFRGTGGMIYAHQADLFSSACAQLDAYFSGQLQQFSLQLDPARGTAFQRQVWRALQEIPYGQTETYAALAVRVGSPKAVRAVGAANGKNPFSIIVPCHRVIATGGALRGYAGGIKNKQKLLNFEAGIQQLFAE